jgi:hypothetical protein
VTEHRAGAVLVRHLGKERRPHAASFHCAHLGPSIEAGRVHVASMG